MPNIALPPVPDPFRAIVLDRRDRQIALALRSLHPADLPPGELLVRVAYASLNYKDALAVTGRGRIIKSFPCVPGVDLVGTVLASEDPGFAPSEAIVVSGRGIGEERWGGFAQLARLPREAPVRLPAGLAPRTAAAIGTAGFTAMLALMTLEDQGCRPGDGEVLVTGAAGGVGSFAVALLAAAGYRVVASTGRTSETPYLERLGAAEVIDRAELSEPEPAALGSARWAGAVDNVGGRTLANLIAGMRRHGTIASCGLAGGAGFESTVYPFILRGVNLMGVDSNYCPPARRQAAWERLAIAVTPTLVDAVVAGEIALEEVPAWSEALLAGKVRGRLIVDPDRSPAG